MEMMTSRLALRELDPGHAAALNEIHRDPRITRYMTFDPQTMEQTKEYIASSVAERSRALRSTYDFAIVCRADNRLIGRCGLGISRPEHKEAAVWYVLHPDSWGRGFAGEAVTCLLEFGFVTLGLHRVYADCDPRNMASCKLVERLGFRLEGTLRENYFLKGEWCSAAIYGLLSHEFAGEGAAKSV